MENLKVENPCPMLLMKMSRKDDVFTCKSCKKDIVDFRGKSQEEIACTITANTCGIFTRDQLPGQQRMPLFQKGAFYALTVLSFLGFNVSPLNAAPSKMLRHSGDVEIRQSSPVQEKEKDKKKKKKKSKKKQTFKVVGTPSF